LRAPQQARPVSESPIPVITVIPVSLLNLGVVWEAVASRKSPACGAPLPAGPMAGRRLRAEEVRLLLDSIVFPTCAPSTPSETASCYHGPEGAHGGQLISAWLPCWARRRHLRLQPRTISCRPIAAAGSALGRDPRRAAAAAAAGSCHPTHSPFLPQTHNSHLCAFPPQEDFDRAAEEAKALPDGVTNDDKLAV
jgi:hypothetical protein